MTSPGSRAPRIGIFGGSFDPVHMGHLSAAREVGESIGLSRILLVPARRSPHKTGEPIAPSHLRLAMLRAAVQGDPLFEVSEVELEREDPSFTVETLAILSERNPGVAFFLLLGADQWSSFGRWRRPREIAERATIVLMTRSGEMPEDIDPGFEEGPPPPFLQVDVTRIDIASTLVRKRVREGRSVRYLVPEGVREIIAGENLYLSE